MKTKYFFLAAAAALFAACSSDDGIVEQQQAKLNAEQVPVAFESYVNRGLTRAGAAGTLTTSNGTAPYISLQNTDIGFGVFGYYTDGVPYSETSTPNFMYNQLVTYNSTKWEYTPVKYWPNEFGNSAESEGSDKLTFFAYAPYVNVIPRTGRIDTSKEIAENALTSGIVGMTSNVATGDPYVKYYVDFDPDNRVDLCWGVAAYDPKYTSSVVGGLNGIAKGSPYIDVFKPQLSSVENAKIKFNFLHALASLNVQIDADVDIAPNSAEHTTEVDKNTRIWVRSVTFEGFTDKGTLNLNATADEGPLWYELTSTDTRIGSGTVTIFDGRRDGKEAQTNAVASNEKTIGLNPCLIQQYAYQNPYNAANGLSTNHAESKGVRKTAVNLFAANGGADDAANLALPIFVIPTDEELKVTIVYDVETYDPNVAGYLADGVTRGSVVENKISKTIKISDANVTLKAGYAYIVKLHLGMTSVQFDAAVQEWGEGGTGNTDLPINAN